MNGVLERLDARLDRSSRAPVAVALSGGSDSTALLRLTLQWARRHGREVLALSVDHQIQPDSGAWTRQALAAAVEQGARGQALAWTGAKPATGLPAAARRARHALLAEAARAAGAGVLLMGHTQDDLDEAAQMRRDGSTVGRPAEWSPSPVWPEGRGVFVLRPMLGVRRAMLRSWLAEEGIAWLEDPANADARYARARARAALAGRTTGAEPGASPPGMAEAAAVCATDAWGGIRIPAAALSASAGPRLLQFALACVSGRETPPKGAKAAALMGRLASGADRAALGGARVTAEANALYIVRDHGERARGGLSDVDLVGDAAVVWDGRFVLNGAGRAGPLAGRAAALDADQRRRLKGVPAAARGALPAIVAPTGQVHCPLLAPDPGLGAVALAGERFKAACGVITREG